MRYKSPNARTPAKIVDEEKKYSPYLEFQAEEGTLEGEEPKAVLSSLSRDGISSFPHVIAAVSKEKQVFLCKNESQKGCLDGLG